MPTDAALAAPFSTPPGTRGADGDAPGTRGRRRPTFAAPLDDLR